MYSIFVYDGGERSGTPYEKTYKLNSEVYVSNSLDHARNAAQHIAQRNAGCEVHINATVGIYKTPPSLEVIRLTVNEKGEQLPEA